MKGDVGRRIKIVSDGFRHGTAVRDAETNELIEGVTAIHWDMGNDDLAASVTLEFEWVEVEVEGVVAEVIR